MTTPLTVQCHNGTTHFQYYGASASQVRNVLDIIQPELRSKCGDYRWRLIGGPYEGYKVIAHYSKGQFTESRGKSPSQALRNFNAARQILAERYNVR